ncbi:hypothetical protein K0M31_014247 [Melipona bicolor]|uniref:Uncharacterized protein n=1 Tax=Melipona bicolor TaxID=60889 RepID=A0AA40G864_9HYME|nr:hypothetical protein K0M31_014247 [Melipona bicolor]
MRDHVSRKWMPWSCCSVQPRVSSSADARFDFSPSNRASRVAGRLGSGDRREPTEPAVAPGSSSSSSSGPGPGALLKNSLVEQQSRADVPCVAPLSPRGPSAATRRN